MKTMMVLNAEEDKATIMTIFIILIQLLWLFVGIWIGMKLR